VHNRELVKEILSQIDKSIDTIKYRFQEVDSIDYFLDSPKGQEKLDSICMQFIAIGESLKKVDKLTNNSLLKQYPNIEWKAIKGLRDILSHHYFDLNAEAIYNVCNEELEPLHLTIKKILAEI